MVTNNKILIVTFTFFSLLFFIISADVYGDSRKPEKETFTLADGILSEIRPDALIINDEKFTRQSYVEFYRLSKDGYKKRVTVWDIALPCVVDITYHTFLIPTEENPFNKDEKVVVRVVVKLKNPLSITE